MQSGIRIMAYPGKAGGVTGEDLASHVLLPKCLPHCPDPKGITEMRQEEKRPDH